ncbi:MAG: nuclear transport factor 2 family protein [Rhodospirillaceae bacterium]|jgi:hypothetical protein|nr:nuclear transport factor 2 family protein [Rhodospirillaceae bacterium]MBT3930672.1 nuclear transport factor 2 family protein [Rhodospirillaceae bacterium]MBT4772425.1 nuclear transport factor 2 family protein [Rhodospirillaceae bacterium]MBT5358981.1 nuclear transport factor 2 family protein [Rhodospirillaceae bacterium]MBT5769667.1 nuclear transport factor 2 family protein [Rhodospirillaceae bacterium]
MHRVVHSSFQAQQFDDPGTLRQLPAGVDLVPSDWPKRNGAFGRRNCERWRQKNRGIVVSLHFDTAKILGNTMKTIKHIFAYPVVATALMVAPLGSAWAGDAETKAIVEHHLASFGAGDMKETLADYTETSVIVTQGGELRGLEAIQGLFTGLFAEFAKPGASFDLKILSTANNVGYIVWSADTADNVYELGSDTYVIEGGKIAVQTLAIQATPKK